MNISRTLAFVAATLSTIVQAIDVHSIEIKVERYRSRDCIGSGPVDLISNRKSIREHACQSWHDEEPFKAIRYYWDKNDYFRYKVPNVESYGNCSIYIWEDTDCFGNFPQVLYDVNVEEKLNSCMPISDDGRTGKSVKILCYAGQAPVALETPTPEPLKMSTGEPLKKTTAEPLKTTTVELVPVSTRF